jgi:hypothetical protein
MSEEKKTIKLEGEQFEAVKAAKQALDAAKKAAEAAHEALWGKIAELHPETKDGCWSLNVEFEEHGLLFVTQDRPCGGERLAKLLRTIGAVEIGGDD